MTDRDRLLTCYDLPAEHGMHIRTPHPIESTIATIHPRSDHAQGCVRRATMLVLIDKLGMNAEKRWQRLRGFQHLAKVIAGIRFIDGVEAPTPSNVV